MRSIRKKFFDGNQKIGIAELKLVHIIFGFAKESKYSDRGIILVNFINRNIRLDASLSISHIGKAAVRTKRELSSAYSSLLNMWAYYNTIRPQ